MTKSLDIQLYNPMNYLCGQGILQHMGDYAGALGHRAFLVGTPHSLQEAGDKIRDSLSSSHIVFREYIFCGYPTEKQAAFYASEAQEYGADFLIAVGGGRVIDTVKYGASLAGKSVITVPTISATNASYRRDSIIYTEDGKYEKKVRNQQSPVYVLADLDVLIHQPVRYFRSGVIDTLVRWYETSPYAAFYGEDLHFQFSSMMARSFYEYFRQKKQELDVCFQDHSLSSVVSEGVTRIIGMAGLSSNYGSSVILKGFAHPFYNQVTRVRSSAGLLHGEIVGYGILVQLILEGVSQEVFQREWDLLASYGFDYSLEDMGIFSEEQLDFLSERLYQDSLPSVLFLRNSIHASGEIKKAVLQVHRQVMERRKEQHIG